MLNDHKIAVFSNVSFENHGNQSLRNFIEGFLLKGYKVILITIDLNYNSEHVRKFVAENPGLKIINPLFTGQEKALIYSASTNKAAIKTRLKAMLRYRKGFSNSEINQWFSIVSYIFVMWKMICFIKANREMMNSFERLIFIDVYGGVLAKTIKAWCPELWKKIYPDTAAYYLGTVLKQFKGNSSAFFAMPISFFGSYKLPVPRIIITDDGTDGEKVFRTRMFYKGRILFLRNGIDERLMTFENSNSDYSSAKYEFVTCSRLTRWKRVDRAIQFIAAIKRKSTFPLHLTIIGEGNERPILENLAKEEGVSEDVSFIGGMEYNKALQCISTHKYYIVFNDLSNLGNQIYEAICLGLVPVTIDDGSTDSILQHGKNAMKFPLSDSFADKAADMFLQIQSEDRLPAIFANVEITKELLFTWRQRNKMEQDFLSLTCDNHGFGG